MKIESNIKDFDSIYSGFWEIQEKQKKFSEKFSNYINNIVLQKLKEKGIYFDLQIEKERRFKKLKKEKRKEGNVNFETYFYDDNSVEGLRIVTFEYDTSFPEIKENSCVSNINIKYY